MLTIWWGDACNYGCISKKYYKSRLWAIQSNSHILVYKLKIKDF